MITQALDYLDSKITKSDWEKNRHTNKFLQDCKARGFKHLEKLGAERGGFKKPEVVAREKHESQEQHAIKAAEMINVQGLSITETAYALNIPIGSMRYYCTKFGIVLTPLFKRKKRDHSKICAQALIMVNKDGRRLAYVARALDATPPLIINSLKSNGYKYNAKLIKIKKIKK